MGRDRNALSNRVRCEFGLLAFCASSLWSPAALAEPTTAVAAFPEPAALADAPSANADPPPSMPATTPSLPETTDAASNAPGSTPVTSAAALATTNSSTAQPAPQAPVAAPTTATNAAQSAPLTPILEPAEVNTNPDQPAATTAFHTRFPERPGQKDRATIGEESTKEQTRSLAAMLDVGFPDGVIAGAAFRPTAAVRLQAGAGTNAVSPGFRAGAVLVPFGVGPSLTLEGGWYFEGNANGIAGQVVGSSYSSNRIADRVGYQFANAHLGVDFGRGNSTFFIHGGMSYIHAKLHNANDVFGGQTTDASGATTTYKINGDPNVNAFLPSFKLGFLYYFV
jgi:hypothetical protein